MINKRELVRAVWRDVRTELDVRGGTWLPKRKRIFGIAEPMPGEVFSSWVHRSSITSRLPLKKLKSIWRIRSSLYWIDCRAMPLDVEPISAVINHLHIERVSDTLWPLQTYLRKWRGLSLTSEPLERRPIYRYCAECLKGDEIPFFRKAWRLAFNYVCVEHGVLLRNSCPACNKKIDLNRERVNKTFDRPTLILRYCQFCGADLCLANPLSLSSSMYDLLIEGQYKMQILLFDASKREDTSNQDQVFGPAWTGDLLKELVCQVELRRLTKEPLDHVDHYITRVHSRTLRSKMLLAGVNGVRLFGENSERVKTCLLKQNQVSINTYWLPRGKLAIAASYEIDQAISWLERGRNNEEITDVTKTSIRTRSKDES